MNKINVVIKTNPEIVIEVSEESKPTAEPQKVVAKTALKPTPRRVQNKGHRPKLEPQEFEELKSKIREEIPFSEIMRDHGVKISYLYTLKSKMRKDGELEP